MPPINCSTFTKQNNMRSSRAQNQFPAHNKSTMHSSHDSSMDRSYTYADKKRSPVFPKKLSKFKRTKFGSFCKKQLNSSSIDERSRTDMTREKSLHEDSMLPYQQTMSSMNGLNIQSAALKIEKLSPMKQKTDKFYRNDSL